VTGTWRGRLTNPVDEAAVLIDGAWAHRYVSANGSRFHIVEAGTGPLVLFLHGFPEFWWVWHHQLRMVADAGFRAVAVDLRGYGASDKPPRGYDGYTMAGDVAGLIRALGERSAVLVGAGYGGMLAWTAAAFHPRLVRRLVVMGAAHPLRLRASFLVDPRGQLAASGPVLRFQIPRYEHVLAYRWAFRSVLRVHGYRFVKLLQQPIVTPTLHLQGAADTALLSRTAQGSGRYVIARYEWRLLDDIGHFPHVEAPDLVTGEILRWAKEQ
jgi:pimeloyl-ACP methyl ester carboxylesterase